LFHINQLPALQAGLMELKALPAWQFGSDLPATRASDIAAHACACGSPS
jgi:hypothetical protein